MNRDDVQGRSPGLQQRAEPGIRLGDLYQELEQILQRSELLAASGRDDQIHELARHLTALRSLLADLLIVTGKPGRRQDNAVLEQLAARFLSIEGKVKEIRNDRALRGSGN